MATYTENGIIYEDIDENTRRVVGYAQPGQPSGFVPPNARRVAEAEAQARRQAEADARAARSEARADRSEARASRPAPGEGLMWGPDGQSVTFIPGGVRDPSSPYYKGNGGKPMRQGDADKLSGQIDQYDLLKTSATNFNPDFAGNSIGGELENWAQGLFGTGTPGQRDWWANFRSFDNLYRNELFGASLTEGEKQAYAATSVTPSMDPEQVRTNVNRRAEIIRSSLERRADRLRAAGFNEDEIQASVGEFATDLGIDIPVAQSAPEFSVKQREDDPPAGVLPQGPDRSNRAEVLFGQPPSDNQNGGFVPYGAETRLERNPQWKGVNEAVKGMIVAGRPAQEIKAFMNSKGIAGDVARGVDDAINYYRKTGKQDFGVDVENIQVPMSGFDQFRNNAPQTMVGTAAATALNAGGFGIPQMVAGGEGLDYLRQQNPGSAFAGDVAGVIGGTAALGAVGGNVAGRLAPSLLGGGGKAAAGRQLATDAAYGGIYGATTEGTPQGALTGALTAGLGSAGGQVIGKGIQTLGRGVNAPGAAQLYDQGITPTLGQIGRSRGGIIGNTLGGLEDRISGIPFVGEAVGNARNRGLQQSNVGDLNNALRPVGGTVNDFGTEGYAAADDVIGDAYQAALDPMRLQVDDGLRQAMDSVPQYRDIIEQNLDNGMMTGRGFQAAKRTIDGEIAAASGAPMGYKTLPPLQTLRDSMFQSAEAQAPDLLQQYRLADEAYNNLVPIRAATAAAENTGGLYTPAQLGRSLRSTDRSVGKRATARGDRPGQDMQTLKQEILPSKVPDSGTVGRGIVAAGVGIPALGGATINPLLAGLALPAAAYTKIGQDLVAKALLAERPKLVRQGAGIFGGRKARKALSGAITAPLLTDY